ncbi:probable F-box protein At4g22030 [Benincasa hispida]|uniref:probable F-box protein At4g22030 n=1 Tax=Benincasa hispida TaxID=102211 RepID=UPI001900305A|nr:probable F-box protein At4g22030 [Benincasa hispida]
MAAFRTASLLYFKSSSSSLSSFYSTNCSEGVCKATMSSSSPMFQATAVSLPKLQSRGLVEKLEMGNGFKIPTFTDAVADTRLNSGVASRSDPVMTAKLYAVMEAIADRVEMHRNVGEQRDNWNRLLLTSLNAITLGAATMVGLAAAAMTGAPITALKMSSMLLYLAATGISVVMNKLQPSQLAEEQRNAARLFQQLHCQLQSKLSVGDLNNNQVEETMEKVLALDRAYPLPLLGSMIEKFPTTVEPATWWPQQKQMHRHKEASTKLNENGWGRILEEEMREIVRVLKREDLQEYLRLSQKALKINKILAVSGPLLTLVGAIGSAFVGSCSGAWPALLGAVAGSMASVVNTMEHGGQVGMVFEMYRSNAGFFKLMEETIESNVNSRDVGKGENGEVFEMKVALQLGRSLSELRQLALSNSREELGEFASKLF